ncbi:Peptidase M43, pregnancy-associated plasma-A [Moelleriella libera RCEF 2490]|uniref:Peptidase M43, pregnancy-associated plasma-A n=1 Tax=Moelleriella libera RCEF 2490 TaxID=1081109 RepID=A0A168ETB7_9HYPO|nr:Peptidase M43, pregnancy-associated plasma-A [Moelleriella libera RCEF 2490]
MWHRAPAFIAGLLATTAMLPAAAASETETGEEADTKRPPLGQDDIIREQIDFLNNEFRNYSFAFHLKGTKRIANRDWAAGRDNVTMVRSIQKDAYNTLNVFFLDTLPDPRHAGVCSLPVPADIRKVLPWDACLVRAGTVPGGRDQGINSGKVLVHEAGHWLGLLHPFDSFDPDTPPCDGIGDAVDDTPAAGEMWFECKPHDSCPDQPGMDPIHNHMSYTPEDCRHEFTPGQTALMHEAWRQLRTPGPK